MIVGTIRNTVNLTMMDAKWQQKKQDTGMKNQAELTPQERELAFFQEQVDEINESRKPAEIDAKLEAGAKLTPEEIEYLRRHNPEALKEYEQIQEERKAYKRQLQNCKSKKDVEQLKLNKMGQYLSQVKSISGNPNIPKGQKLAMLKKIVKLAAGVDAEHRKFVESARYASLPEDEEEKKKRKGSGEVLPEETEDAEKLPGEDVPEEEEAGKQTAEKPSDAVRAEIDAVVAEALQAEVPYSKSGGQSTGAEVDVSPVRTIDFRV